jgi:hypothetical protein
MVLIDSGGSSGFKDDDPLKVTQSVATVKAIAMAYAEGLQELAGTPAAYSVEYWDEAADKAERLTAQQQELLHRYAEVKALSCALEEKLLLAGVGVDVEWILGQERLLEITDLEVDDD